MTERQPAEVWPPSTYITEFVEERGWDTADFARELGWPMRPTQQLLDGKRAVTTETAQDLARVFGTSAQLWVNLEVGWQSSLLAALEEHDG